MIEFVSINIGTRQALVHPAYEDEVAGALLENRACEAADLRGRNRLLRFRYSGGTGLIRDFKRGGFVRHFTRESYWFVNRPLKELKILIEAREKGLNVPQPLGACWERRGWFYRGRIASHEVDARHLLDVLGELSEARALLMRAGRSIREMHDADIYHADLQVRNILVSEDEIFVIDFDNARADAPVSRLQRARNLLRLRRSMEKNGLPASFFDAICAGYGSPALPRWLSEAYRLKGSISDLFRTRPAGGGHEV